MSNEIKNIDNSNEHLLETGWRFWFDKKHPKNTNVNEFRSGLIKLGAFNTIEGFWRHYIHLKRPSNLENNTNLYLFRDGEGNEPMWESFPDGGCWILKVRKGANGVSVLGKLWQDLVFGAIGESFEDPGLVGIAVSMRLRYDLLSVWVKDDRNPDIKFAIGEKLKEILDLELDTLIEYKSHRESLQDQSTFKNTKSYVFAPTPPTPPDTPVLTSMANQNNNNNQANSENKKSKRKNKRKKHKNTENNDNKEVVSDNK